MTEPHSNPTDAQTTPAASPEPTPEPTTEQPTPSLSEPSDAEPAAEPVGTPEPTPEPESFADRARNPEGTAAGDAALRREAASRRRQVREVEAERDALRDQVTSFQRREVEQLAAERLNDSGDLWLVSDLDKMLGEDGSLDRDRIDAELGRVLEERPHWEKAAVRIPSPDELHAGVRGTAPTEPSGMGEAIKRAARRR